MFLLYLKLAGENKQSVQELLAGFASLFLIILFIAVLPYLIEKNYKNYWLGCIVFSTIGLVYSFVEIMAFAVTGAEDFKDIFRFMGVVIFLIGFIVMALGTVYMYAYIFRRVKRQADCNKDLIVDQSETLLDKFPYGGVTTMFNVYTVLLFWMSTFVGMTLSDFENNNVFLGPVYLILFFISPPIIGWIIGRTLPRRYYIAKIEKIIALHNEEIKIKQNGKRN
ncbi:hypothetical protein [Pseudolactococcus paracarnosus]|uniref:Uncharacterized protein n=1 Tax=Pseudolactococcus paracarnosus TaxID=2749962 RepID=A0ABT0AN63_9LACT|nr:hypothetical protein [Lactococcus paracarnosus]MCJ1977971.1 hypothetical protein [Lactococcus paracarnosus]MCJ1984114.1 hypothetical protein [Lactococcus paracarnosus]MCJ1997927.1 hypothetical protein [Lactococcus paracarnosus]